MRYLRHLPEPDRAVQNCLLAISRDEGRYQGLRKDRGPRAKAVLCAHAAFRVPCLSNACASTES